jgi:hypothetical protein
MARGRAFKRPYLMHLRFWIRGIGILPIKITGWKPVLLSRVLAVKTRNFPLGFAIGGALF